MFIYFFSTFLFTGALPRTSRESYIGCTPKKTFYFSFPKPLSESNSLLHYGHPVLHIVRAAFYSQEQETLSTLCCHHGQCWQNYSGSHSGPRSVTQSEVLPTCWLSATTNTHLITLIAHLIILYFCFGWSCSKKTDYNSQSVITKHFFNHNHVLECILYYNNLSIFQGDRGCKMLVWKYW